MTRHFDAAPWPTSLKVVSLIGTVVLGSVAFAAYLVVPAPAGFTHRFGLAVASVPLVVLVASVFFVVRGYTVDRELLSVKRLVTSTRVPLLGLTKVWADPSVCRGSLRVFGNGGLFSFSGWFYNKRLGRYRLFATDLRSGVVLQYPDKVVVVSPATPQAFVQHLQHVIPGLRVGPEESRA
jgi:Bacterial PH domain